jgi:hypothetical protein
MRKIREIMQVVNIWESHMRIQRLDKEEEELTRDMRKHSSKESRHNRMIFNI